MALVFYGLRLIERWRAPGGDGGSGLRGMHVSMAFCTRKSIISWSRPSRLRGWLSVAWPGSIVGAASTFASGKKPSGDDEASTRSGGRDPRGGNDGWAVAGRALENSGEPSAGDEVRFGMGRLVVQEQPGGPGPLVLIDHRLAGAPTGSRSGETVALRRSG